MSTENEIETIEVPGIYEGPRIQIRSVRRGKITVDESLVEKVITSAKFGEIRTQEVTETFWVEYPTLSQPDGPHGSRYAAEQALKAFRENDTDAVGTLALARIFAVAQGIGRRVVTCEREISDSEKLIPVEVVEIWNRGMALLREGCRLIDAAVPAEDRIAAFFENQSDDSTVR